MKLRNIFGACVGAVLVGALLSTTGAAASTPASSTSTTPSTSAAVRLVTGDVVNVTTDAAGRQTASVVMASHSGPAGAFRSFTIGSDLFVVPQSAAPYFGSTLDPSLFDVTRLARHPQASLHVNVTLRPGVTHAVLPGATLHRVGPTQATGTLTAASSREFGRALAAQAMRDHASSTHTTGLFRSISHISVSTGAPAQHTSAPADSHTLTVKGIDWNGDPDNGDSVNIYNIDDLNLYSNTLYFSDGEAQATVPDGHYSALTFFYDYNSGNIYELAVPQFTVSKDTTVTMDARDANAMVSVTTPKPASPQVTSVGIASTDALGNTGSYTFLAGGANTFYAQPTKHKPTVGQFHYYVYTRMFSTGSKGLPYTYDLKFPNEGRVRADQSYAPRQKSLATINAGYAADHPDQQSLDTRFAALPWETFLFASDIQFTAPVHRHEYYTARTDVQWEAVDYTVYIPDPFTLLGEIDTSWEAYTPGMWRNEAFRKQPTIPRLLEHNLYVGQTICPVCLGSINLDVLAFPFADSSPFHRSYPDSPTEGLSESANWSVRADGREIASGTGLFNTMPAVVEGAKTYTLRYDEARSSSDFLLSTDVSTVWRVKTRAPEPTLPDGWVCDLNGSLDCTVLPVMSDRYYLPVNLLGQIASGHQQASLLVSHLANASIKVKHLSFELSYDGGKTWTPAKVTDQKHGHYGVSFTVPKKSQTDGYGAIRLVAKDARGGALNQTIMKGFAVK